MAITINGSPGGGEEDRQKQWGFAYHHGGQRPESASPQPEESAAEVPDIASEAAQNPAPVVSETPKIVTETPENVIETPEAPARGPLDNVTPSGYYRRKPTDSERKKLEGPRQRRIAQGYSALIDIFDRRDAWEANPEEEARRLILSDKSGMPTYFMDDPAYIKEANTRAQMRDSYAQYEDLSPTTLNWMRAADNLRIARDDALALDEVYKSYERMALAVTEGVKDFAWWKPLVGSVADLIEGWAKENRHLADVAELESDDLVTASMGNEATRRRMIARMQTRIAQAIDPGAYLMPTSTLGQGAHDLARSSAYSAYAALRYMVIQAATNVIIPGGGAAKGVGGFLLRRAGFLTGTAVGVASESESQAARAYEEALQRGVPKEEAMAAARNVVRANIGLLIATESIQNALFFGMGRMGRPLVSGAGRGARMLTRAARVGEFVGGALFEGVEEAGQDVIDAWALGDEVDTEALKWSFAVGVASGGIYGAAGSAFRALGARAYRMMDRDAKIDRAQKFREGVEDVTTKISETKTASRIPEKMEDFVRNANDGSMETVYIDGQKLAEFAQMADAESIAAMQEALAVGDENASAEMQERIEEFSRKLAEDLGITDIGAYFEALATGADVEVDTAKLLAKIGTDEDYAALKDHIKLSPTEMSAFEAQQAEESRKEDVRRLREEMEKVEAALAAGGVLADIQKDLERQIRALEKPGDPGKTGVGDGKKKQLVRPDLFGKTGANARKNIQLTLSWLNNKAEEWGVPIEKLVKPGEIKVVLNGDDIEMIIPNLQEKLRLLSGREVVTEGQREAAQARQREGSLNSIADGENRVATDAERGLSADEAAFADVVDNLDPSTVQREVRMMTTPLVFNLAGADILPVYINTGKLIKIQKDHPTITKDILKQIPRKLANPIAIFDSRSKGEKFNAIVAMLELKDGKGATVVVALHLQQKEGRYVINKLASIYAKNENESGVPRDDWFAEQVTKGRLRYVNTKKAAAWSDDAVLQLLPSGGTKQQLMLDSIKTESDLRKLKNAYPDLYQNAEGTPAQENIKKYGEQSVQGRMRWKTNEAIIILHLTADKSTFLHEISHFFLEDLRESAHLANAPDAVKRRWNEFVAEFGLGDVDLSKPAFEDKRWYNAQERFAVGFEIYLMEGKAPTKQLEGIFRAFKKWLLSIYKTISGMRYLDADGNWQAVEINDNIRRIYDRMLASEEAIEHEAVMSDMAADEISLDSLRATMDENVPPEAFAALDDAQYEVVEAAKERLLAEMLSETEPEYRAEVQRRAEELKPFVRSIVEKEPVYRAITEMQADEALRLSREEILNGFGDTTLAALPEGIDAENGVPIDTAATAYGFSGAQEMLDAMTDVLPLEVEVERRATEQALRDRGAMEGSPEKIASKAEDALYEGEEALDKTLLEAEMLRNMQDAELEEEAARVETERENPMSRRNVVKFIKEQGRLSFRKVKEGYGNMEARELAELTGGALWRNGKLGLDEAVQLLQAEGVPVRDEGHLAEILKSDDGPRLSTLDKEYQKGFLDARAANRRAREQAQGDKQKLKEWNLLNTARLKGLRETLKAEAEGVIGAKQSSKAVDPKPYIRAAQRAERAVQQAIKKGDLTAAAAAKDRKAINETCARAAVRAGKEQDRILHFLRKYANRPNKQTFGVAPPYLAQIDAILNRFDLRKKSYGEQQIPVKSLAKFVEELQAKGEPVLIPDEILDANYRKRYTDMSMDELRALNDAVKNIEHLGKSENKFISGQRKIQIDNVATQIKTNMYKHYGLKGPSEMNPSADEARGVFKKVGKWSSEFLADLGMAEFITRAMDGNKDLGPAHQHIFQPIRDAVTRETKLLNETFLKANELTKACYGTDKPGLGQIKVELDITMRDVNMNLVHGKNWVLTMDKIIAAVLNMGNAGNLQRMMDGWGISRADCQKLIDALRPQDVQFVQGIWDLFESLRPMAQETAEIMTGVTPQWVEATPLVTKYGTLRGGYYPLVTDLRYSKQAARQEELSNLMETVELDSLSARTRDGYRRERADNVLGRPPVMDLAVVDKKLAEEIHDFAFAPALRDVNKVIHHAEVTDAVKQALGDEQNKVLNHWLRAVASNNKNNGVMADGTDRLFGIVQRGVTTVGLGLNAPGAILQYTGFLPLASRIGGLRMLRAMTHEMQHPVETRRFVMEKSAFMLEQMEGQDRDVRKMREKWTVQGKGKLSAFRSATLGIYSIAQNRCNIPGWLECYKMGMETYKGDEAKAIRYADSIIRQTQGAGTIADLTRFETSGTWKKIFTFFYSWFRVMHNLNMEMFRRVKNEPGGAHKLGVFMNHALWVWVLPSLAEQLIRRGGPDEENDETWPQWLLKETALSIVLGPLKPIPFVRDIIGGVESMFEYGPRKDLYRFTPATAAFGSIVNLLYEAGKAGADLWQENEPDWGDVAKSVSETAGYWVGLPTRQLEKWWGVLADTMNDEATFLEGAYRVLLGRRKPKD